MKKFVAIISLLIVALLMAACGTGDIPVSDGELLLTFNGDSCTYEGPTRLKAGPVTLVFFNESEGAAGVYLVRHTGEETIQDAIDYIGEEPSSQSYHLFHVDAPTWVSAIQNLWRPVSSGESNTWEGDLEQGIYHMVCEGSGPSATWFGTGLTVVD